MRHDGARTNTGPASGANGPLASNVARGPAHPLVPSARRIPLALKLAYTAFMAVLVPVYSVNYGPTNFLYFCDAALFVTLVALWAESAYLASMQALAISIPQAIWVVDFLSFVIFRRHVLDLTGYMFDGERPLFLRGLSFFHFWLPFLLLWTVRRLGYDRRAWIGQTLFGAAILVASFVASPLPIDPRIGNLNKIHGPSETIPQTWMAPALWLALLIVGTTIAIYLPTHALLSRCMPRPTDARRPDAGR